MERKSLLTCSYNTRELGGMRTADGRTTKCGVIWRSDVPSVPTAEDAEKLRELNITTIIDMRTEAECKRTPDGLADMEGFDYHHFPITEGSGVPESLEAVPHSYMSIAKLKICPMCGGLLPKRKAEFFSTAPQARTERELSVR